MDFWIAHVTFYSAWDLTGQMVRASASGAVDLGLIPSQVIEFKIGIHSPSA